MTMKDPQAMLTTDISASTANSRRQVPGVVPIDDVQAYAHWCSMFEGDSQASPFQHPEYVLTELQRDVSRPRLQAAIVQVGTTTDCEGSGILVPKSVRTGQVGGIGPGWNLHGYRLAGGSFLSIEQSPDVLAKLLTDAMRHCTAVGADFLLIEDLDEQSPLSQAIASGAADGYRLFAARDIQPRWRMKFPVKEEEYWNAFSGRTRRAFRARLKKIGQSHLERVTEVDQIPSFLSAAHEISKQSWQSRQFGLRIRNDETEKKLLSVLAQHGLLRSYLWRIEGEVAAFAICSQHADYFRYEEIAYCAQFGSLSPGETLLQQIIVDLFQHRPPRYLDFGGGDAEYKRRFGNHESRSQTLWLVPPTWRAGSSLAWLNGCRGLRSAARNAVKACGLATRARQWIRYGGRPEGASAAASSAAATKNPTDASEESGQ
jgi:hypothetical protein